MLGTIESHRDIIDYEAVRGFVNGIYACANGQPRRQKTIGEVVRELQEIQKRLFDSNVVVDVVVDRILDKTKDWPQIVL